MLKLHGYFRSSTSYRVRIALNLKGLDYETIPVNLLMAEHQGDGYRALNPMAAVPTLEHDGFILTQSLAIMEYLDDIAPTPPLVYGTPQQKAYIRQVSDIIATDIHPVTNLRILKKLVSDFSADEGQKTKWYADLALKGISAVEATLRQRGWSGDFVLGEQVSMADLCLVPQMYNLRRFDLPLEDLPICRRIEASCMKMKAFQDAAPEMQPDAPEDLPSIHGPTFKGA